MFGFGVGGGTVNQVRHFCISIIAKVLNYEMYWAQVSHVEVYRRARIPKLKTKSVLNIDSVLLFKLSRYGICGVELKWFKSYLSQRKQTVKVSH